MSQQFPGIHHVSSIASDPQRNIDFYTGVLGLRLVKRTVNFDLPKGYHFYYGDGDGTPGTILTFFPWPRMRRGQPGTGQVTVTAFSIPEHSIGYWLERLRRLHADVTVEAAVSRFDEQVITITDPDDLTLELVASDNDDRPGWQDGPVPGEHAIRGFHSVALAEEGFERTDAVLTELLGFRRVREEGNRFRYATGEGGPGTLVDVLSVTNMPQGTEGAGTVHHVAWRTPDDEQQAKWRRRADAAGLNVTPVRDRQYFRSIYFREPGGVLFEIATDSPGFLVDEAASELGTHLKLPPWLEPKRAELERSLPPIRVPSGDEHA